MKEPLSMINDCSFTHLWKKELQKKKEVLHPGLRKTISPLLPLIFTVKYADIKVIPQ